MARTVATNFTGANQFPYATAATDLFKKEDIQTLALAVDNHNHTAGLGLALAAGSIPNGTITSAMIADGTITTADLGANSTAQAYLSTSDGTTYTRTATNSAIALPGVNTINLTTAGGAVLIWATVYWNHSVVGGQAAFGVVL